MSGKYKEYMQFEVYGATPFKDITGIGEALIKPREVMLSPLMETDGTPLRSDEPNVYKGRLYRGKRLFIDRRQYVKVFSEFIDIVVREGISAAGVKMLFYVLRKLEVGRETVCFTMSSAKALTGYKTDKSIYEGLVDLIRLGVIARKEGTDEELFINPEFIFKGRRQDVYQKRYEAK